MLDVEVDEDSYLFQVNPVYSQTYSTKAELTILETWCSGIAVGN